MPSVEAPGAGGPATPEAGPSSASSDSDAAFQALLALWSAPTVLVRTLRENGRLIMYAIRQARSESAQTGPKSYFDPRFACNAMKVLPGEYLVTDHDLMLVTVLGSCVSACMRDPVARVGGMNHFMLPDGDGGSASETARYGGYAMEMLINDLLKVGASRRRLETKVFGGGAVLPGFTVNNVGERNGKFVLSYLEREALALSGQDLFDVCPRRVHYFPMTGRVMVKRLPSANDSEVLASESLYRSRLRESPTEGSVELF